MNMDLLNIDEILNRKTFRLPIIKGIYFLINKTDNIVYIGKSKDCYSRIKTHQNNNRKVFKNYSIHEFYNDDDLDNAEISYIKKFNPFYNKAHNVGAIQVRYATKKDLTYEDIRSSGRPKGISTKLKDVSDKAVELYLKKDTTIRYIASECGISVGSLYRILRHKKINYLERHKGIGNNNAGLKRLNDT